MKLLTLAFALSTAIQLVYAYEGMVGLESQPAYSSYLDIMSI